MAAPNSEDREQSIANLFREISQETAGLVRDELDRVRDEVAQQGKRVAASAGLLGAAGALGVGAFGAATAGLVAALGRGSTARGAFMVTVLYGAAAAGLALMAHDRLARAVAETGEVVGDVQRDAQAAATGAGYPGS